MIFQIFSSLFILCLLNQVLSSPVIIYNNVSFPQNSIPFSSISSLDLISEYICKLTNEQIQLRIFGVDDLTIEDILRGSQQDHSLLLDAKNDTKNFLYFPNVHDDSYQTFSLLPRSNNMRCSHIHFELLSAKTYETLSDALNTMQATIDNIRTNANNPAVIIALMNAPVDDQKISRRRRQTVNNEEKMLITNDDQTCMFYAEKLYWNDVNGTQSGAQTYTLNKTASSCKPSATGSNTNVSSVILHLVWINEKTPNDIVNMDLNATIIGLYWYLTNATLNNNEFRYFAYGMHSEMDTPPRYSYVCTTATFTRFFNSRLGSYNFTNKFYITNFQFQPFYGSGVAFGQPNYCTSFFTSGIWMGITSSLLCLAILLIGIHRMMTIKSNDRFDDPKGKPLVIKTQD